MTTPKKGRPPEDFARAHDPLYIDESPAPIFKWVSPPRGTKRYLFTCAQNGTPVAKDWWAVLRNIERTTGAKLVVIPLRYKNPTSRWGASQNNAEWWDEPVRPYLCNERAQINPNFIFMGDIKVQPTASDPVGYGDLSTISRDCSAIIGHPKIQTRSIATPSNKLAKVLLTSGSCTQANYSDTRMGRVGEFHHSLSAVLVEVDGKRFYARRLHFDTKTKSCTDSAAGERYYADRMDNAPRPLAVVCGDLHLDFVDPRALSATVDMIESTKPQHVIWHDAADGYPVNHHHGRNPFNRIAKRFSGMDDARMELTRLARFMREHTYEDVQNVIVAANHTDDFLGRWVVETDWRDDPTNADFYLETALAMVRRTKMGEGGAEYPSPFKYHIDRADVPQLRVLDRDESFVLANVALDMHGDKGPNGARGSIRNLRRIGTKSIIGHGHSPGEDEGATQVGTLSRLRLEYNKGPSSWLHANAFLGADGKRQLVIIVDGEYRLRD